MDRDSNFSSILSKALDTLGYSFQAIKRRVEIYDHLNECTNAHLTEDKGTDIIHESYILAGSKREGISLSLEGDYDQMFVRDDIKCTDKVAANQFTRYLKLIKDGVPNGYTKLQIENESDHFTEFSNYVVYDPVYKINCLSSKLIMANASKMDEHGTFHVCKSQKRAGPSTPIKITTKVFTGFEFEGDIVTTALPCLYSDDLFAFTSRVRCYGFPSQAQLDAIYHMEGHAVPVGHKGSDDQDLQWRICYTLVEIKLIQSFNATQYQLYIVLKMLAKKVLKPLCSDITSYVMKNIIMWVVEITPNEYFQPENLSKLIIRSMLFLKILISEGYIPNYLIPERNLLAGKIIPWTKNELIRSLSCLIDRGESMVLECDEIEREMIVLFKHPSIYGPRLEERNSFIEYTAQLSATGGKFVFQRFESVKAFTDEMLEHFPMVHLPKVWKHLANIPGCVESSASLLNKPLVVETAQQLKYSAENINSMKECILSNPSKSTTLITPLVKKTTELLNSYPELIHKIMPSNEFLRILRTLVADGKLSTEETTCQEQSCKLVLSNPELISSIMTPEYLSKIQQNLLPHLLKILSENPQMIKDMIRFESETNFAEAVGEDNIKLILDAQLRSMDVEDGQRMLNNPAYHEYINKMLKGLSM